MNKGTEIYEQSIVIDACAPLACPFEEDAFGYEHYLPSKITMIAATILPVNDYLPGAIEKITKFYKIFRGDPRVKHILTVEDIYEAKKKGQLGIMLAFQGCSPLQNDLEYIDVYYNLGLRQMMLCYNIKNCIGDGCTEPGDGGLSTFGVKAIARMNELGILVDLAHTGYRTTMEAMEVSKKPVVFSHGNARAVWDNPRNLRDDQVIKVAKMGGVVGVNGYPGFVSAKNRPTVNDFIDHIDYYVKLVGIDHVSLGVDYFQGQAGIMEDKKAQAIYDRLIGSGSWSKSAYPPPPYYYPEEIAIPKLMPNLSDALLVRGYGESDIKKILGENYIRILKEVWK